MSIKNKYIGILLMATAMLLSACSSDNPEAQTVTTVNEPVGKVVQLMSYASPFTDQELSHRAAPAGFTAYTPDKNTNMGVYMLLPDEWASPQEERITYNTSTSKWNAYFEVTADKKYTVYGYVPKTGKMGSTLAKSTADAATLTITGIKPVTTDDICIITGVKDTDDGLKEGNFNWKWPISTSTEDESYKIHILMDHLYAAAQFRLKIDADYASLRTIKLKTMKLRTNKDSVNATIALTHNDTGASPISSVTYDASGSSDSIVIFNNDEGVALDKTKLLTINSYFAPTLSDNLTLVSTYDVYDSKGNLIRQNCTATNKLPDLEANRGQRVLVNLTVNPTYAYVMSDPDMPNPTITIGN